MTTIDTPNGDAVNDAVDIDFVLAQFAGKLAVDIGVFDLSGVEVRRLVSGVRSAGAYREAWDGKGENGTVVPPGIYIIRFSIKADAEALETAKLIGVAY